MPVAIKHKLLLANIVPERFIMVHCTLLLDQAGGYVVDCRWSDSLDSDSLIFPQHGCVEIKIVHYRTHEFRRACVVLLLWSSCGLRLNFMSGQPC
jgi:hypothetical protein